MSPRDLSCVVMVTRDLSCVVMVTRDLSCVIMVTPRDKRVHVDLGIILHLLVILPSHYPEKHTFYTRLRKERG